MSEMTNFQSIMYERISSNEEEEVVQEDSELPPAFVSTRGTERNGRWNHIENLDDFFTRVYEYFQKSGFTCLVLGQAFGLLQYVFVVLFTTFLFICVDYKELFDNPNPHFSEVIDWHKFENMHHGVRICLVVAFLFWCIRLVHVVRHSMKAWEIRQFYYQALHITDDQLQNMVWNDVQTKLVDVQKVHHICIHKRELSELDIHHRILRKKNYLIAMQNKNVIPCIYNFPVIGKRTFLTEGLKYNLDLILFSGTGAPFESSWKIRREYKDSNARNYLAAQLSRRIFMLGIMNLCLCPFIFVYQVLHSFFTYGELIKRSPDLFGARRWSLYGRLYLRHFNELDHEFKARLSKAYEPSTRYINAFNSPMLSILCRNIAFFAGAILAVLLGLSFYDQDVLTAEHVISFMATLGIIIKICAGFIPDEHAVWCPETMMKLILAHTHYIPDSWKGKAHTSEVREQFQRLFQYKFIYLLEELFSAVLTPYILCFVLRHQAQQIVDFYRNFTVDVTGVGDVCSFAQMSVRRQWPGDEDDDGQPPQQPQGYQGYNEIEQQTQPPQANNQKTELSLLHFSMKNPTWRPTDSGKQFIETIKEQVMQGSVMMTSETYNQRQLTEQSRMGLPQYHGSSADFTNFIGLPSMQSPRDAVTSAGDGGLQSLHYPNPEVMRSVDQQQAQDNMMQKSVLYMYDNQSSRLASLTRQISSTDSTSQPPSQSPESPSPGDDGPSSGEDAWPSSDQPGRVVPSTNMSAPSSGPHSIVNYSHQQQTSGQHIASDSSTHGLLPSLGSADQLPALGFLIDHHQPSSDDSHQLQHSGSPSTEGFLQPRTSADRLHTQPDLLGQQPHLTDMLTHPLTQHSDRSRSDANDESFISAADDSDLTNRWSADN